MNPVSLAAQPEVWCVIWNLLYVALSLGSWGGGIAGHMEH